MTLAAPAAPPIITAPAAETGYVVPLILPTSEPSTLVKPRFKLRSETASRRDSSYPIAMARMMSLPEAATVSPRAKGAGTTAPAGWMGNEYALKSRALINSPFAKAALPQETLWFVPSTADSGGPPNRFASSVAWRPLSDSSAAVATPIESSKSRLASRDHLGWQALEIRLLYKVQHLFRWTRHDFASCSWSKRESSCRRGGLSVRASKPVRRVAASSDGAGFVVIWCFGPIPCTGWITVPWYRHQLQARFRSCRTIHRRQGTRRREPPPLRCRLGPWVAAPAADPRLPRPPLDHGFISVAMGPG